MFNKKKQAPARKGGGEALMAQMGIGNMDQMDAMIYGDLENDADLEAELAALTAGDKPKPGKALGVKGMLELDRMVQDSLRDMPSDEEMSDTEDPDLLAELQGLSTSETAAANNHLSDAPPPAKRPSPQPVRSAGGSGMVTLLQERLEMYTEAKECARAKGDNSKARRMDRGTKTLQDLLRRAKAGKMIDDEDIPPVVVGVTVGSGRAAPAASISHEPAAQPSPAPPKEQPPPPPPAAAPAPAHTFQPTTTSNNHESTTSTMVPSILMPQASATPKQNKIPQIPPGLNSKDIGTYQMLKMRGDQYKIAALQAKKTGNTVNASMLLRTSKQFDKVMEALVAGQEIDLSQMPPAPVSSGSTPAQASVERAQSQRSAPVQLTPVEDNIPDLPEMSSKDQAKLFKAPEKADSVMDALQQRLQKYRESANQAKQEGSGSKARRMGRIAKQYDDAIKAYKAGKAVDFEELPTPPGFPPIPARQAPQTAAAAVPKPAAPAPKPAPQLARQPAAPTPVQKPATQSKPPPTMQRQASVLSRAEQQAIFLQDRQLAFKKAAVQAKSNGDMELAKKYLRMAKGFDQMIEAAHSGLPVDMSQVPAAPGSDEQFEMITHKDVADADKPVGDRQEMYPKLEQELINQIRTCSNNSEQFIKLGDVSSANKFQKMGDNARKDLDALKNAFKHGDPVPRFHYETRTFSLVQSNTELGDNDLELTVVRGLNYGLPSDYAPKDLSTYVKYEFPYPNDDPQKGYTDTAKATNSPEYNQSFKLEINRKSRAFLRLLKSKSVKLEVYYKRGFLKSDKLLGTVNFKLSGTESKCTVHESLDLVEGRKSVGGKLEVKMRVRDPFSSKQVEETKEKWLVIDHFDRALPKTKGAAPQIPAAGGKHGATSMEVLKYEKQVLDAKIKQIAGGLDTEQEQALLMQSHTLGKRLDACKDQLKSGGLNALKAYLTDIEQSKVIYFQEAQHYAKQGNREKAQMLLNKKKLVEKEVAAIRAKLPR